MLYLGVLHYKNIAEDGVEGAAASLGTAHAAFCDNYVVLFGHASDCYRRTADKHVILNLPVKRVFPFDMNCTRYDPSTSSVRQAKISA